MLVIGDVFLELVFGELGEALCPGTELYSSAFGISCGGAVTVAAAARDTGVVVALVTSLGDDLASRVVERYCNQRGIDLRAARRVAGVAGGVTVALNFASDRALVSYHPERVAGARPASDVWSEAIRRERPDWIYLHARPGAGEVVREARALGCKVALDVDLAVIEQDRPAVLHCLEAADLFLPNEAELGAFAGRGVLEEAVASVLPLCPAVVVKRGLEGAVLAVDGSLRAVTDGLSEVAVLDRTGAGDAFAGALLGELARGRSLLDAMPVANAAGTRAVARLGAAGALAVDGLFEALDPVGPPGQLVSAHARSAHGRTEASRR